MDDQGEVGETWPTPVSFDDAGLGVLADATCWGLLESNAFGRLGLSLGALPMVLPVAYETVEDALVCRVDGRLRPTEFGTVVCFQIDEFDADAGRSWSVSAIGRLEPPTALEVPQLPQLPQLSENAEIHEPVAAEIRSVVLPVQLLSGRVHEWH